MKFKAVIQARLESTRLPRKVIREIYDGITSLDLVYNRLLRSSYLDEIVFAIPDNEVNVELRNWLNKRDYRYEIGHETDLMSRYLKAVDNEQEVGIVRVTSDCPFVDPEIVDKAISKYKESNAQYVSTYTPPEKSLFCNGSDIEIFSKTLLKSASEQYTSSRDKEHVTFQFWDGRMNIKKVDMNELLEGKDNYSDVRITLDYEDDLDVIKQISKHVDPMRASIPDIVDIYRAKNYASINGYHDPKAGWK